LDNQQTIKWKTEYSGIGLHTGIESTVVFKPAAANSGIKFIRTDLPGNPVVPALIDYVTELERGTTIQKGDAIVHTVEHLLAAITGLGIDNIDIEISGKEPPVGDGSALPFVNALMNAGIEEQNVAKNYLIVDKPVFYKEEERNVEIAVLPLNDFRMTVMIDFQNPALGSQHTGMFSLDEFVTEFAPARTFCFLKEVEYLLDAGLIKGADLSSALVIVDENLSKSELKRLKTKLNLKEDLIIGQSGILNDVELRFKNEPCRHKLLDLIGDLTLVGVPLKAQVLAARSGHKANIGIARKLRKIYEEQQFKNKFKAPKNVKAVFDINAIEQILPHRYPFLMIDRIIELEIGKYITAIKNVTVNEEFFNGHFPGHPIMPGVLIVEAIAQAGGMLLLNEDNDPRDKLVYFASIDFAKFKNPVIPGDQLLIKCKLVQCIRGVYKLKGEAYVDGKIVCDAQIKAVVRDR